MTLALLCSGQGHQHRAMFDLLQDAPGAASVLAAAATCLGEPPAGLLAPARDDALHANRTGQILCVTRALAVAASLALPRSLLIAGYSVGEMAAWGIAGCWSPAETLRLTAHRAELMDKASGPDDGLGFIRGLDRGAVDALTAQHDCAVAIINPALLFAIGGSRAGIARCCTAAMAQGAAAARPIAVHVASHTPRLAGAVPPFRAALAAAPLAGPQPGRALIGAADAMLVRGVADLPGLAAQLATTIDWAATLGALVERGARHFLELGPGRALADMARAAYPALDARAIDDFRTLDGVSAWIAAT